MLLSGCYNTVEWHESFRFTGTVEEVNTKDNILIIKEYGSEERKPGIIYEIPTENIEEYSIGDKLLVIVSKNTLEDDWDLDHLKFKIEPIE